MKNVKLTRIVESSLASSKQVMSRVIYMPLPQIRLHPSLIDEERVVYSILLNFCLLIQEEGCAILSNARLLI